MRALLQALLDWVDRYVAVFVVVGMLFISGLGVAVVELVEEGKASSQAGAEQRVTTISQRCDLTAKIIKVLRKDDPARVAEFEVSYAKCLKGLRKAEKLAGVTAAQLAARSQ